jgi:hypothetical protein
MDPFPVAAPDEKTLRSDAVGSGRSPLRAAVRMRGVRFPGRLTRSRCRRGNRIAESVSPADGNRFRIAESDAFPPAYGYAVTFTLPGGDTHDAHR